MKIWEIEFEEGKKYSAAGTVWEVIPYRGGLSLKQVGVERTIAVAHPINTLLQLEFEEFIDWGEVKIDTKVVCSQRNFDLHAHFARYEDGKIYTFACGTSSFTTSVNDVTSWDVSQVKLYKED